MQKLEVLLHLVLSFSMLALIDLLGNVEDKEERYREDDARNRGHALSKEVNYGRREQNQVDRSQTERDLEPEILCGNGRRHLPAALAREFKAQHQDSETVKGKAPYDAEGVCLAQGVDVSATRENREQLQAHDQI